MTSSARVALVAVAALAVSACGAGASPSSDAVAVSLSDYAVQVADTTLPSGSTRLTIQNNGATIHELEVFSVPDGVDVGALPIVSGVADTNSAGLTIIDEIEDIAPGTSPTLTVSLQPGTYAFICNLPTHYQLGMHTLVTVE